MMPPAHPFLWAQCWIPASEAADTVHHRNSCNLPRACKISALCCGSTPPVRPSSIYPGCRCHRASCQPFQYCMLVYRTVDTAEANLPGQSILGARFVGGGAPCAECNASNAKVQGCFGTLVAGWSALVEKAPAESMQQPLSSALLCSCVVVRDGGGRLWKFCWAQVMVSICRYLCLRYLWV